MLKWIKQKQNSKTKSKLQSNTKTFGQTGETRTQCRDILRERVNLEGVRALYFGKIHVLYRLSKNDGIPKDSLILKFSCKKDKIIVKRPPSQLIEQ